MAEECPARGQRALRVTAEEVARRRSFLHITEEDERRLERAHPLIQRHADWIIDQFYDHLLAHPFTRRILEAPGVLARLRGHQRAYFEQLTQGRYDEAYFEDRLRIGHAHDRIGLSPEWYLGAYHKYLSIVSDVLSREMVRDYQGFFDTLLSLTKVIYLDMGLAMDAYIGASQERLSERNQKLEELDARKRLLTDTIVHDLRNPIAGIQGFLSVFKTDPSMINSTQLAGIDEAERACSLLNTMVDNVLAISCMEDGKLPVESVPADLRSLADEVAATLAPFAESRGRRVCIRHATEQLPVRTDPGLVQRIMLNLIMNSIRHADGASFVEIETAPSEQGGARVSVADDGAGIPQEFHQYIFERYGRARLRDAGLKLDTGLGLVFCRMAAHELGADLGLVSDAGKGARFDLVLPFRGPN